MFEDAGESTLNIALSDDEPDTCKRAKGACSLFPTYKPVDVLIDIEPNIALTAANDASENSNTFDPAPDILIPLPYISNDC